MLPPLPTKERQAILGTRAQPTRSGATYRRYLTTFIRLPAINEAYTWNGASEIVKKYVYDLGFVPTLREVFPITRSAGSNICACVAWKPTANTIARYKLWKDVGEILYFPLYNGEVIDAYDGKVLIEYWNTKDTTTAVGGGEIVRTSKLIFPTSFCSFGDIELGTDYLTCTDFLFPYANFTPIDGDYFVLSGCAATLIEPVGSSDNGWLIKARDGTWHRLYVMRMDGISFTYTLPVATPPVGTKEYLPLIDLNSGGEFDVRLTPIGQDPDGNTLYGLYIGGLIVDTEALGVVYLKANDNNYYGVRIRVAWDYLFGTSSGENSLIFVDQHSTVI